jgi:hypothetical protein
LAQDWCGADSDSLTCSSLRQPAQPDHPKDIMIFASPQLGKIHGLLMLSRIGAKKCLPQG